MLFRLKKKTSTVPKPGEEWDDTPETFPVDEVFRKSCLNWKRYLIFPLAMLGLDICILVKMLMIIETMSHASNYLNPHSHPVSVMTYLGASLALSLLSIVCMILSMKSEVRRTKIQHNRVQQFVNNNGTKSIPQLLDLLLLRIKGGRTSSLPDRIVYNLTSLLSQADTHSKLDLNSNQHDLLVGLLEPEGEYSKGLSKRQRSQLRHFSIMLAPSVMHVVGIAGGEKAVSALHLKLKNTLSDKVKRSIQVKLNDLSSEDQILSSEFVAMSDGNLVTSINRKHQSPKRYVFSSLRSIIRFLPFLLPILFPLMLLVFPDKMNSPPEGFLSFMTGTMIGFVALILVINFVPMFFDVYQRSLGLRNAVQDHPESISNFLSIEVNSNSIYTQAIIIGNLLENTELSQLEPLNISQLNKLHRILSPPNLYKSQITAFYQTPLPEIGTSPAILRGLVYLGNKSSVKVIEKFYKTTENEEHKRVALECLDALNARLTEKPEQLLRASSLASDALLRASQPAHTTEELLKPMVAEEPIVFPQTEEIDGLEVNRQKL